VSSEWFTTRGPGAGSKSPLERFMASWHLLKVKSGKRTLNRAELCAEIERRGLSGDNSYSTLVVEAIDRGPWADAGQVRLDWVDLFVGDEPRARRQLRDPKNWNGCLRPDLIAAAKTLKATGNDRVMVRGYMRLALWFMCGVELPDIRQHQVACKQKGQLWASEIPPTAFKLADAVVDLSQGPDLAVGLSVTNGITADVASYCKQANLPVARYVDLSPQGGVGPLSLPDAGAAVGWAHATRDSIRAAVRDSGARRVHLFMSAPAGAALLLGHIWNRVGTTIVYEDLSPGYVPTFELPG